MPQAMSAMRIGDDGPSLLSSLLSSRLLLFPTWPLLLSLTNEDEERCCRIVGCKS